MNPILIVDDEAAIAMLVRRILTEAGYRCQAVTDSRAAANLLEKNRYYLVLLDVMMPHLDGYDLLAYLRPTGTPCIFITAKDAVAERVRGLNSGADDYIVKPFAPTELVARVESVLRRAGRSTAVYTMWEYTVDAAACRVLRGEEEMHLTRKEYDLLLLFLRNRGRALYRDYLYETVWGDDGTGCDTRTLDTHIARLRRKLSLGDRLHSVRQIGYMLEKERRHRFSAVFSFQGIARFFVPSKLILGNVGISAVFFIICAGIYKPKIKDVLCAVRAFYRKIIVAAAGHSFSLGSEAARHRIIDRHLELFGDLTLVIVVAVYYCKRYVL